MFNNMEKVWTDLALLSAETARITSDVIIVVCTLKDKSSVRANQLAEILTVIAKK